MAQCPEETAKLKQDSGTNTPLRLQTKKTYNSKRISVVFPIQPQQIDNVEEFMNQVDEEERFLYEQRQWDDKGEQFTVERAMKEHAKKHKSQWSWSVFIEFMVYHISFMLFLGPFMILLFGYFPGMTLLRNMKFWGLNFAFFMQTFLWAASAIGGLGYFLFEDSIISFTEVIFLWFGMIYRCVVISAKYATLGENFIQMYKKYTLPDNIFNFDLMMQDWRFQSPKILFIEPYRSLKRYQFEISLFKFDFIVPFHPETHQAVIKTEIDYIQDVNISLKENQYSGFQIFGYLCNQYTKKNNPKTHFTLSAIEATIFALTPIGWQFQELISNSISNLDLFRLTLNGLALWMAVWGTNIFYHQAFYDFNRKFFLLEQALYMIQVVPEKYSSPKLLPTINFNNPQNFQAWSMFRAMCFDYGQAYNLRTQGFYSLGFAGFIICNFIVLLWILGFMSLSLFEFILFSEYALSVTIFTSYYLYMGAKLNSYNDQCEITLQDLKSVYLDLLRMKDFYIEQNVEPSNYIHKKFNSLLKSACAQTKDVISTLIQTIIAELDDNIRIIDFDERNNPFKLYGIKITYNLLKSAGVGLSTVYSYTLQQRFMQQPQQ